jgi:hypothetical protein
MTMSSACFGLWAVVTCDVVTHECTAQFKILRPSSWMNPNFRTPGRLLIPSAMGEVSRGTRTR